MDSGSDWVSRDVDAWDRPIASLGLLLHTLRARIALWVAVSVAAIAHSVHPITRWLAPAVAVIAALLGALMVYALARHLSHPGRGGRTFGALAVLLVLGAIGIDLAVLMGGVRYLPVSGDPLAVVILAELAVFAALAPLCGSHAGLAARLGAPELRRRCRRAAALVVATLALLGLLAYTRNMLPDPRIATALAALIGVLVVLSFAKVLGATRFLLAYLRTMHAPRSSQSPLELRAWHQA